MIRIILIILAILIAIVVVPSLVLAGFWGWVSLVVLLLGIGLAVFAFRGGIRIIPAILAASLLLGGLCGLVTNVATGFGRAVTLWNSSRAQAEQRVQGFDAPDPFNQLDPGQSTTGQLPPGTGTSTVGIPTGAQAGTVEFALASQGYADLNQFAAAWGIIFGNDPSKGQVDPAEVGVCPFEANCLRILREKDMGSYIIPFQITNPTSCTMDGWMDSPEARATLGRKTPAGAIGSGVPSGFTGLVQGITIRPCNGMIVEVASAPAASVATGAWDEAAAKAEFQLGANAVLAFDGSCYAVSSSDGQPIQITNPRPDWVDGYRDQPGELRPGSDDPKLGIPPGFSGLVGGATLCPAP